MFELIDFYGIHYSNDYYPVVMDMIKKKRNIMNTNNCLIPVWCLMNMLIFSNMKCIIDHVVGQNWYKYIVTVYVPKQSWIHLCENLSGILLYFAKYPFYKRYKSIHTK